jgi:hypothetical protein
MRLFSASRRSSQGSPKKSASRRARATPFFAADQTYLVCRCDAGYASEVFWGTHMVRALLLLCFLSMLIMPAASASQEADGSSAEGAVRAGLEYDDNVLRAAENTEQGLLSRYFVHLRVKRVGTNRSSAVVAVDHGGKIFFRHPDSDTLLTDAQVQIGLPLVRGVAFGTGFSVKDRTERVSARDYNRGSWKSSLSFQVAPLQLKIGAGVGYFLFKSNTDSSSDDFLGDVDLAYVVGPSLRLGAGYHFVAREFLTNRFVYKEYLQVDGKLRQDRFHLTRLGVSYRGWLMADANYQFAVNRSNSYGQALHRHALQLMATVPLFWDLYLSIHGEIQRTIYEESIYADASFSVDEDNRNALVAGLTRTIFGNWEVEAKARLYLQEFGSEDQYVRQTWMLSLAYLFQ